MRLEIGSPGQDEHSTDKTDNYDVCEQEWEIWGPSMK